MNRNVIRSLSLLALASVALSAHASLIHIEGTVDNSNIITSTTLEQSDYFPFSSGFGYTFFVNGGGALYVANFASGGSSFSAPYVPGSETSSFAANVFTYSGTYMITNPVNFGLPAGSTGSYSGFFDQNKKTFMLDLANPTSTPAPAAAIPFALGFLRRRRRK